ncbi:type I-F CRISPR-associated helicase Cas3f [Marinimicrobium sp. C6131]|uniref:type I-F CRISPR-associated helicase Cas3f n=1 Tax=Marinimicrobium sp. C6131 TaxID=3022676 RepID=UPI00223DE51E|nr:type I-F CRISPR-associated helicase Cas3f [Marinimicrobium sp. C6131]UZJ45772.1 type I-F CRISPR-associated helicase Cas3f [Marinimicrobium sp. C6131]
MNVLLVSQCSKRALTESRRILDQFAERRGDRTWQTAITMEGLNTLRKLLRKTARKNTAVACHWIRGKDHSELMWIVGNASQFNLHGAVPTNSTQRNIVRRSDEDDWHTGEDIKLLAQLAGLLHDLGKASIAFQQRLAGKRQEKHFYRHEWVSLRLFLAFVGQDDDATWLKRMMAPTDEDEQTWLQAGRYWRDGLDADTPPPFDGLPPLASAVAWLVLTHHRLPVMPVENTATQQQERLGKKAPFDQAEKLADLVQDITHKWNEQKREADTSTIEPYWDMAGDLPVNLPKWRIQSAKLAKRLLALKEKGHGDWLDNPYVMHLARLSLMLADHYYSSLPPESLERVKADSQGPLFANTGKDGKLKQTLDEHLLGVARMAGSISHALPGFERYLPRLARHKGLKKRSSLDRFRWQDKGADAATAMRDTAAERGAFIVNMASTGCGKTLANARILNALADPVLGMRATFALGLRTLTLQTGRSYREDLNLGEDELAIRVGGSASRALFEYHEAQAEQTGSASTQDLIEEDSHVLFEGEHADHPLLSKAMANPKISSLLSAPMLVCTIDHLMPATEAQRAGRQIAPMLRLMSSDLVLDELDDFDLNDLPALARLVHWAGLLGSRVVLSSATLPPALLDGMFQAYRAGRQHYHRNRGDQPLKAGSGMEIPCLWVDEFGVQREQIPTGQDYTRAHSRFVEQRVKALDNAIKADGAKRRGTLVHLPIEQSQSREQVFEAFANAVRETILPLHADHCETCPHTGKKVSFGLVRMANIEPLFYVAEALFRLGAPEGVHIHLCVYHSRLPLLLRSAIENQLDTTLNRRQPEAVFERADIRAALDGSPENDHLFVVLGSPVTEVGRDHDYAWAVVEPSSMRSLIQLAGRVQRHRQKPCQTPNIAIFETNLRHYTGGTHPADDRRRAAFVYPGFEDADAPAEAPFRLATQKLSKLLREDEYRIITARPRIQPGPQPWQAKHSLVDLEHARLAETMLPKAIATSGGRFDRRGNPLNAASAWQYPRAMLTCVLPQQQPFRSDDAQKEVTLVFLPDEDEERLVPHRIFEEGSRGKSAIYTSAESLVIDRPPPKGERVTPWGQHDLLALLLEQAEAQGQDLSKCAEKFTTVNVLESAQGWWFDPVLGFSKKR